MNMFPAWWDDIRYFKPSEFDSPDEQGSGAENMKEDFVRLLDELRSLIGKPVIVTSGFRTATLNSEIGGAPRSKHLGGMAADVKVKDRNEAIKMGIKAASVGFKGIGVYDRHVHLDLRDRKLPAVWFGKSK